MADSDVTICNLALSHLGDSKGIASLTERSAAARACSLWYEQTRDELLREFPWPFAARRGSLALVAQLTGAEWGYSYRVPTNTLAIHRLLPPSGMRIPSSMNRVPFLVESDATGAILYTDLESAELEYSIRITDPLQFPPDFVQLLALKLAANMAPTLTAGDPNRYGLRALELYERQLGKTKATALNEAAPDAPVDSEFIAAREDGYYGIVPRPWGGW